MIELVSLRTHTITKSTFHLPYFDGFDTILISSTVIEKTSTPEIH